MELLQLEHGTNVHRMAKAVLSHRRIGIAQWAASAAALACLSSCSETSAPDKTWALLNESDEAVALVNTDVVAGETPAIWFATVYKPTSELPDREVVVSQRRYKFDCKSSVGRVDYSASYDRHGKLLREGSVREKEHPLVPNSHGDVLMKLACGFSELPHPTHSSPLEWLASSDEWAAASVEAASEDVEAAAEAAGESFGDGDDNGIADSHGDAYLQAVLGEPLENFSPEHNRSAPAVAQ